MLRGCGLARSPRTSSGAAAPRSLARSQASAIMTRRNLSTRGSQAAATAASTHSATEAAQTPLEYTTTLQFRDSTEPFPVYRVLDLEGRVAKGQEHANPGLEVAERMYRTMVQVQAMDSVLYDVQRQGRISFYMAAHGEEAIHVGSAAALRPDDVLYAQYREQGVLLWRGFTLDEVMAQCYATEDDAGKGRQMPVHYGSARLNLQTVSSPLATQLPQAAGAAYALAHLPALRSQGAVAVCYFGEGAASEGDFHPALNFSATLRCPAVFFCRNNGYAISTPAREQYAGDGIAARGPGYGVATLRVDGNDAFAVWAATAAARKLAAEQRRPVLLEAMTYRVAHHSTSDDSARYRPAGEIDRWTGDAGPGPMPRLRRHLEAAGRWDAARESAAREQARADVLTALSKAEQRRKPALAELFTDVYAPRAGEPALPWHLAEQQAQLRAHLALHPDEYPLADHVPDPQ